MQVFEYEADVLAEVGVQTQTIRNKNTKTETSRITEAKSQQGCLNHE